MGLEGLIHCSANYAPLTPITFLERAARIHGDRVSVQFGAKSFSWKETYERCIKLASALSQFGLCHDDTVAAVAPNIPELYELHFAVPMAGTILSPLNPLLDAAALSYVIQELEPKLIFVDYQYLDVTLQVFEELLVRQQNVPLLILIPNPGQASTISSFAKGLPLRTSTYNELLALGRPDFEIQWPRNECDPILVSYTSGSTGNPKGVVYSHRAAYLNSLEEIFRSDLREKAVFLWTADMFRANGWGFIWALAAKGGLNVCLREISAKTIFDSVCLYNVTHLSGRPNILNVIANADIEEDQSPLPHNVYAHIAGMLPPSDILTRVEEMGFKVVHRYGMTEVLGAAVISSMGFSSESTSNLDREGKTETSQASIGHLLMEEVDVKDPKTMVSVPTDGKTTGEVMFRGNVLMSGYLKQPHRTQEAFRGGWYHTGDLAVKQRDGRIQLKDRAQDIIVTRGDKISSLEIESLLLNHPKVSDAAVVGIPDDHIDEVPCAFVKLKVGLDAKEEELIMFCTNQQPRLMAPKVFIFGDFPVSSTGKIQKFLLREVAKSIREQEQLSSSNH